MRTETAADSWVDGYCASQWLKTEAAAVIAEAIIALASGDDAVNSADAARARLPMVHWSVDGLRGNFDDVSVDLQKGGRAMVFYWQNKAAEIPYNVIEALRIRGVSLETLGCPQYPGASMGREKVMLGQLSDWPTFILTVYSRPAPTGFDQGIYQVNADFSGTVPDSGALRLGEYPGGGDRAFAVDPKGWERECVDP